MRAEADGAGDDEDEVPADGAGDDERGPLVKVGSGGLARNHGLRIGMGLGPSAPLALDPPQHRWDPSTLATLWDLMSSTMILAANNL